MGKCHVYLLAAVKNGKAIAPIKIGISDQPHGRLSTIQTSCPFEVCMVHSFCLPNRTYALDVERAVHKAFSDYRQRGEWFDVEPENALFVMCEDITGLGVEECDLGVVSCNGQQVWPWSPADT
jgi:hypothetical protein